MVRVPGRRDRREWPARSFIGDDGEPGCGRSSTGSRSRSIVWLFPSFEEALYSGQHSRSPRGRPRRDAPGDRGREIAVIAEIDPTAYELLCPAAGRA